MANIVETWRAEGRAAEETAAARRKRANAERREARQAAREEKPQAAKPKRARKPKPEAEVAKVNEPEVAEVAVAEEPTQARSPLAVSDMACAPVGRGQVPWQVRKALLVAVGATSTDESRPVLCGVLWARRDETTHIIVATDTYRLVLQEVTAEVREYHAAPAVGTYWLVCGAALREATKTQAHRRGDGKLAFGDPEPDETKPVKVKALHGVKTIEDPVRYVIYSRAEGGNVRRAPATEIVGQYPAVEKVLPEGPVAWEADGIDAKTLADRALRLVRFGADGDRIRIHGNAGLHLAAFGDDCELRAELEVCAHHGEQVAWANGAWLARFAEAVAEQYAPERPQARRGSCRAYVPEPTGQLMATLRGPLEPQEWRDCISGARFVLMPMQENHTAREVA